MSTSIIIPAYDDLKLTESRAMEAESLLFGHLFQNSQIRGKSGIEEWNPCSMAFGTRSVKLVSLFIIFYLNLLFNKWSG